MVHVDGQRVGYNHLISNKLSASGIIVLSKTPTTISKTLPDFICLKIDFQIVSNFEQTRTVTIFDEHGIMAHVP